MVGGGLRQAGVVYIADGGNGAELGSGFAVAFALAVGAHNANPQRSGSLR
jgi:hypothetical protein